MTSKDLRRLCHIRCWIHSNAIGLSEAQSSKCHREQYYGSFRFVFVGVIYNGLLILELQGVCVI